VQEILNVLEDRRQRVTPPPAPQNKTHLSFDLCATAAEHLHQAAHYERQAARRNVTLPLPPHLTTAFPIHLTPSRSRSPAWGMHDLVVNAKRVKEKWRRVSQEYAPTAATPARPRCS
jgi:hypothetical protein